MSKMEITGDIRVGNIEVLEFGWRSAHDKTIGVVLGQDVITKLYVGYIGVAKGGEDEERDVVYICEYGAKLNYEEALAFFPNIMFDVEQDQYKY